ncbi:MAG TPA: hypothetical protein VM370_09460 [Candidatus Thermoplasmatota archaeon]|nr:hypothetical protein [Candidatus Thermoplasmatota archaeon]
MTARALLLLRLLLMAALFPALAGCAAPQSGGEALQRGDLAHGDASAPVEVAWATLDQAIVRPGMIVRTEARDCLANYLFVRPDNGAVFLGTTAYCVRDMPIGSAALAGSDTDIAILVYSSMQTMADLGESDTDALEYNDLALFHLDSSTVRKANPTLPLVGGPRAVADGSAPALGSRVRAFSPAQTVPGAPEWRDGVVAGRGGDWALMTYQAPPTAPGAMGGAAIDGAGDALGVVVTLGVKPNPGANAVARLDTMLSYAREQGGMPIVLATPP